MQHFAALYVVTACRLSAISTFMLGQSMKGQLKIFTIQKNTAHNRAMMTPDTLPTLFSRVGILILLVGLATCVRGNGALSSAPQLTDEAKHLDERVVTLYNEGKFCEAIPLAERSLALRTSGQGSRGSDAAISVNNLAALYWAQGTYKRAEPLLIRGLHINEKTLGAVHPAVATSLNNLAALYWAQGTYSMAEPLLARALGIQEKALGAMHPAVAISLSNLAGLYRDRGEYTRAEPLLVRALDIQEKALGATHPAIATTLNDLATLYTARGTYTRAEPLLLRALEIQKKTLGATHPDLATSHNRLAAVYQAKGAYAQAELLLARVLDIKQKSLGERHPEVATSLINLADNYRNQREYARAEALIVRALDINESVLGPTHPNVAFSLDSLAEIYRVQGAHARTEPLLRRALDIREKALGALHPDVATSLSNLALLYRAQGASARAEPLLVRALDINERSLGGMHPAIASSLEKLGELYRDQGAYKRAESLLSRALEINEQTLGPRHSAIVASLNKLALLFEAQGEYARAESLLVRVAEILEVHLRTERMQLSLVRKQNLAELVQSVNEHAVSLHAHAIPTSPTALELAFTTILRSKGRAIDLLADTQSNIQFLTQLDPVTIDKVQAALPRNAALVEFVRYRRYEARQSPPWQEDRYIAYVLSKQGSPRWIALGDAGRIDDAVNSMSITMRRGISEAAAKSALRNLDALVFAPVRNLLSGVSHIVLSPDGALNLVPFDALVDPQGRYALEQYLISYVTSGRDLLWLTLQQWPRSPATIVPDPENGPEAKSYGRLPRPLGEGQEIQRHFLNATVLAPGQLAKAVLARIPGPSVLHIATHGFYARGPTPLPSERGIVVTIERERPAPLRSIFPSDVTAALDHAGLTLSGTNVHPDGIISARELASFDWWGTQLVVLTACGDTVEGTPASEGVYSMRRALVLAGARSQVVSLWKVHDSSGPELVREFYGELARGTSRAEALRQAKLRILQQPRFTHPYYWAAFIHSGDWTPLDKGVMSLRGSSTRTRSAAH